MAKHWQPKPDKDCLIDDLNDFLVMFGSSEISKDTNMTIAEIEALAAAQLTESEMVVANQSAAMDRLCLRLGAKIFFFLISTEP